MVLFTLQVNLETNSLNLSLTLKTPMEHWQKASHHQLPLTTLQTVEENVHPEPLLLLFLRHLSPLLPCTMLRKSCKI